MEISCWRLLLSLQVVRHNAGPAFEFRRYDKTCGGDFESYSNVRRNVVPLKWSFPLLMAQ